MSVCAFSLVLWLSVFCALCNVFGLLFSVWGLGVIVLSEMVAGFFTPRSTLAVPPRGVG